MTEDELARLYAFVEAGYKEPSAIGRLRGAVSKAVAGLVPSRGDAGRAGSSRAADPWAAVYMKGRPNFLVPVAACRNYALFGFGETAFDAWQQTARQLAAAPETPAGDTVLARFARTFRPQTAAELLFSSPSVDVPESSPLWQLKTSEYMYFWPWSPGLRRWPTNVPQDLRLYNHGPLGDRILELEVWRLKRLVRSIGRNGYQPTGADSIRGVLFMLGDELRFVIAAGFHRVAVLAALGHDEVPVELASGQQRLMSLDQLRTWPLVRQGVFSADLADLLVERLFAEDGSEMAARLGLGPGKDGA